MTAIKSTCALLLLALLTGCAVGNTYSYDSTSVVLPVRGTGNVGVRVVDQRPYILDGDKSPSFIGLQRGGFGNPFDVNTASGNSLAADFTVVLEDALRNAGYSVTQLNPISASDSTTAMASGDGEPRNVVLTIREWKTDAYAGISLHFDVTLDVVNSTGDSMASSTLTGEEPIGGAGFSNNAESAAQSALETKLGRLFNTPEVRAALQ